VQPSRPAELTRGEGVQTSELDAADDTEKLLSESQWIPSSIETRPGKSPDPFLDSFEPLELPQLPPGGYDDLPPAPLLVPQWSRAILSGMLATSREGEVDLERLIEVVARGRHIGALPRLPWPTLRRGAQVLIDSCIAMTPFAHDQSLMVEQIRAVAGADCVTVFHFRGSPTRGVVAHSAGEDLLSYAPPASGTPVLLLSDLGIARPHIAGEFADVPEWIRFAERVRGAGCPLIALLPYARSLAPREFARLITLIPWDRHTSSGTVRRLVGSAHFVD
jgi:hypothetical protein